MTLSAQHTRTTASVYVGGYEHSRGVGGVRLFTKVGPALALALALEGIEVIESPLVTHLKYQVGK